MTREVRHIRDFIAADNRPGDLWVYDRPGQLSAIGLSAINWDKFRGENKTYLENLKVGLYNRILIVERPQYHPKNPDDFALQRNGFRLIPLREHELTPEEYLRISVLEFTPGVDGKPFAGVGQTLVIPPPGTVLATPSNGGGTAMPVMIPSMAPKGTAVPAMPMNRR
jgi:hypothetical protein